MMPTYFYPRPPRGGRLVVAYCSDAGRGISIHALREEGDKAIFFNLIQFVEFLSTPSARRATARGYHNIRQCVISIHALREEGDVVTSTCPLVLRISIHALREEGDLGTSILWSIGG